MHNAFQNGVFGFYAIVNLCCSFYNIKLLHRGRIAVSDCRLQTADCRSTTIAFWPFAEQNSVAPNSQRTANRKQTAVKANRKQTAVKTNPKQSAVSKYRIHRGSQQNLSQASQAQKSSF